MASSPEVGSSRIEQIRLIGQGQRQQNLCPGALGKLRDFFLARQTEAGRQPGIFRQEGIAVETGGEPADFIDRHPLVQRRPLGHVAHAAADFKALRFGRQAQNLGPAQVSARQVPA